MILAPLRGVTIRCFRETFADAIREAGFTEAVTPFITAMRGYDPLQDRELVNRTTEQPNNRTIRLTPQFIGKDPVALGDCLLRVKAAGFDTADLNCGCPFPMVRNKGRGSGILRTPDVLRQMLEVGCATMGPGKFSIKARLGVDRNDELLKLMPLINLFPLRFLTVHARNARQMYEGSCDVEMLREVEKVAKVPIVRNGDLDVCGTGILPARTGETPVPQGDAALGRTGETPVPQGDAALGRTGETPVPRVMIGRSFIRALGARDDIRELLMRYIAASQAELSGDRPVLGRMKELIAYWKELPQWKRRWDIVKMCRTVDELKSVI